MSVATGNIGNVVSVDLLHRYRYSEACVVVGGAGSDLMAHVGRENVAGAHGVVGWT